MLSNIVLLEAELSPLISLDLPVGSSETPSATSWPYSLKGGFKIRILKSYMQQILPREKRHKTISFQLPNL